VIHSAQRVHKSVDDLAGSGDVIWTVGTAWWTGPVRPGRLTTDCTFSAPTDTACDLCQSKLSTASTGAMTTMKRDQLEVGTPSQVGMGLWTRQDSTGVSPRRGSMKPPPGRGLGPRRPSGRSRGW
jgi:hypothetical protein